VPTPRRATPRSTPRSTPRTDITAQTEPLAGMPAPYTEPPLPEYQAHWWIRRMDWEALKRCVARLREGDTFHASWTSGLAGASVSAAIGFVTVLFTSSHRTPHSAALELLGLIVVFSALGALFMYRSEKRDRRNRVSHLDALKEEMGAMEHYMTTTTKESPTP